MFPFALRAAVAATVGCMDLLMLVARADRAAAGKPVPLHGAQAMRYEGSGTIGGSLGADAAAAADIEAVGDALTNSAAALTAALSTFRCSITLCLCFLVKPFIISLLLLVFGMAPVDGPVGAAELHGPGGGGGCI